MYSYLAPPFKSHVTRRVASGRARTLQFGGLGAVVAMAIFNPCLRVVPRIAWILEPGRLLALSLPVSLMAIGKWLTLKHVSNHLVTHTLRSSTRCEKK